MVVLSNVHPYEADEVKQAAKGRWAEIHSAAGLPITGYTFGREYPCPKGCTKQTTGKKGDPNEPGGKTRFKLYLDYQETGGTYCRQCGQSNGSGLDTLAWWNGWSFSDALKFVAEHLGFKPYESPPDGCVLCDEDYCCPSQSPADATEGECENDTTDSAATVGPKTRSSRRRLPEILLERTADGVEVAWEQISFTGRVLIPNLAKLLAESKPGIDPDAVAGSALPVYWVRFRTFAFVVRDPLNLDKLTGAQLIRVEGINFPEFKGSGERKRHNLKGTRDGFIIFGSSLRDAPAQFKAANRVWIVEGPTDGLAVARRVPDGDIVISTIGGAESVPNGAAEALAGKEVILVRDDDQAGKKGLKKWIVAIHGKAKSVQVATLPDDCNDLRDAVNAGHMPENLKLRLATEEDTWPEIEPLGPPPPPPFPVDALPLQLRTWVSEEAIASQTPVDLAAILAIATCAAAVAKKVVVQPRPDWREPLNLYTAVLLEPANRKSAVFDHATAPLRDVEDELVESQRTKVASDMTARRQAEQRMKSLEKKAANTNNEQASIEAAAIAEKLANWPEPMFPQLIVDDATAEKLAVVLESQGGRIACMSAEGGVFDLMAGLYSKSGMPNLDVYLKGHGGDDIRVDRIGRKSVRVPSPALTMGLAIQPEVIKGLTNKSAFRGRGLLARFLYAVPQSMLGDRDVDPPPVSAHAKHEYCQVVRSLAQLEVTDDGPEPLHLSDAAKQLQLQWAKAVEEMLGDGGDLEHMRDWGGKLVGATMRIAGILHCIEHATYKPWDFPISAETMSSAVMIGRYLIDHADIALDLMNATDDEGNDDAIAVMNWFRKKQLTEFSKSQAQQKMRRRFPKADDIDPALKVLTEHGYIRLASKEETPSKGRPSSPRYEVNPAVHKPSTIQQGGEGESGGDGFSSFVSTVSNNCENASEQYLDLLDTPNGMEPCHSHENVNDEKCTEKTEKSDDGTSGEDASEGQGSNQGVKQWTA